MRFHREQILPLEPLQVRGEHARLDLLPQGMDPLASHERPRDLKGDDIGAHDRVVVVNQFEARYPRQQSI